MHKLLRRVFHDAKRKRRAGDRQKDHLLFTLRIKRLLSKHGNNPILESFMTKLQNALPNLFTFVLDPRIPPTNNTAERGLCEIMVHRKMRGGMKSTNIPNIVRDHLHARNWENMVQEIKLRVAQYNRWQEAAAV